MGTALTVDSDVTRVRLDLLYGQLDNLFTNPRAGASTTGWSGGTGRTLTRVDYTSTLGLTVVSASSTTTSGTVLARLTCAALTPGTYYARYRVRQMSGTPLSVVLSAGAAATSLTSSPVDLSDGQFHDVFGTFVITTTTVADPTIGVSSTVANTDAVVEVTQALLILGNAYEPFGDGDTAGWTWLGTQYASTSRRTSVTTASVVRSDLSAGTQTPIRNADPATLVGGAGVLFDYEVPFDTSFQYVIYGNTGLVDYSGTASMPSLGRTTLKHPGDPSLNRSVKPTSPPTFSYASVSGVFSILGRRTPIATGMRRAAPTGTLELYTESDAERAALLNLLGDGSPLWLSAPDGFGVASVWVAVGDVTETRVSKIGTEVVRVWQLPITVVDRPVGPAFGSGYSWADLVAGYATWRAAQLAEGTWNGILIGVNTATPVGL